MPEFSCLHSPWDCTASRVLPRGCDSAVEHTAVCEAHSTPREIVILGDADASLVPETWCSPSERWFYVINIGMYLQEALPVDPAFDSQQRHRTDDRA